MVELHIYSKERPKLTPGFLEEWDLHHIKTIDEKRDILMVYRDYRIIYRWQEPVEEGPRSFIDVSVEPLKSTWSCLIDVEYNIDEVKEKGLTIPEPYIRKLRRDDGTITDRQTYKLLQRYPELETGLPQYEPLWGLLKFFKGKKFYSVDLETPIWASEKAIGHTAGLAVAIASKFQGIIWDEQTGRFGIPDTSELFRISNATSRGIAGFLGEHFDIYPVQK